MFNNTGIKVADDFVDALVKSNDYEAIRYMKSMGITPESLIGTKYEKLLQKYSYLFIDPAGPDEIKCFLSGVMTGAIKEAKVTKDGDVINVPANMKSRVDSAKELARMNNMYDNISESNNVIDIKDIRGSSVEQLNEQIAYLESTINSTGKRKSNKVDKDDKEKLEKVKRQAQKELIDEATVKLKEVKKEKKFKEIEYGTVSLVKTKEEEKRDYQLRKIEELKKNLGMS